MRRTLSSILFIGLLSISAFAQSLPAIRFSDGKPQIAYHLFSTWADNYQTEAIRGKSIAQTVLYSGAGLAFAGSAITYFAGDRISNEIQGYDLDPELRRNLALGLGIGGGALLVSGMIAATVPVKDYRAIYADVFSERDSEVQEAMAASVLRYQADRGKERRITSFVSGLIVPLLACGITASINASQGRVWNDGIVDSLKGSSWSMAGSVTSLFTKTPEERLYERYLATRDALYAAQR
jgi:hypothetical protein